MTLQILLLFDIESMNKRLIELSMSLILVKSSISNLSLEELKSAASMILSKFESIIWDLDWFSKKHLLIHLKAH